MFRFLRLIATAARRPRCGYLGIREYRTDWTTSWETDGEYESYDSGRELAHIVTLRRFDPCY